MKQEKIDRINELYHKSQAVGLTEAEKEEQAALRKEYIESIRQNMRGTLNSIRIKEKDGSITDLGQKYGNVGTLSLIHILDARKKGELLYIYAVDVQIDGSEASVAKRAKSPNILTVQEKKYQFPGPEAGAERLSDRPVSYTHLQAV